MIPAVSHSLVQTLRRIPAFASLDEKTLLTIVGESINLYWKAGSTIFKAGWNGEALYIVLEGECSIHEGETPLDSEVAHPREGDFFGELSLLVNTTHSRNATAVTNCEIMVLPKESFTKLLEAQPGMAEHFDKIIKQRLTSYARPR